MPRYAYLYDQHSETGLAVADALGMLRIRHENSQFRGRLDRVVLNWGSSELPTQVRRCDVINSELAVYKTVNKKRCLKILQDADVFVPEFFHTREEIMPYINQGLAVYGRHRLTGHDGQGLVRYTQDSDRIDDAPLYTVEVQNVQAEYRATVVFGRVICIQKKVRADDHVGALDLNIRTTAGGWGFRNVDQRFRGYDTLCAEAESAINALDLHFGGVDIVQDGDYDPIVLEVNTAPELTPLALRRFVAAINVEYPLDN